MPEEMNEIQLAFERMAELVSGLGSDFNVTSAYAKKLQEEFAKHVNLLEDYKKAVNDSTNEQEKLRREVENSYQAFKEKSDIYRSLKKTAKQLDDSVKENEKSYRSLSKTMSGVKGMMRSWGPIVGAQTISIKGAVDQLLKYNQSIFTISRSYQVIGRGTQDFTSAFARVSDSTALSRNQFLDFTNTAIKGWQGIAPGVGVLSDLAEVMHNSLGPGVENLNQGMGALLQTMEKYPAVAKTMVAAMSEIKAGGPDADRMIAQSQAHLDVLFRTNQMTRENYMLQSKMIRERTKEQGEAIEANEAIKSAQSSFEDAMLSLGQEIQPVLKDLASSAERLANLFEQMPGKILAVGMALKGVNAIGLTGIMASAKGALAATAGGATIATTAGVAGASLKSMAKFPLLAGGISGVLEYNRRRGQGHSAGEAGTGAAVLGGSTAVGGLALMKKGAAMGAKKGMVGGPKGMLAGGLIGGAIGGIAGIAGGYGVGRLGSNAILGSARGGDDGELEDEVKGAVTATMEYNLQLQEVRRNFENIINTARENYALIAEEINILSGAGILSVSDNMGVFTQAIDSLSRASSAARESFEHMADPKYFDAFRNMGIDVSVFEKMGRLQGEDLRAFLTSADYQDMENDINRAIERMSRETVTLQMKLETADEDETVRIQERINELVSNREVAERQINDLKKNRMTLLQAENAIVDAIQSKVNENAESVVRQNSAYEERLNTEKQLMESAQFGMGASLQMMQKQVDMGYELMDVQRGRISQNDQIYHQYLSQTGLGEQLSAEILNQVRNAKSHMDVVRVLNQYQGLTTQQQRMIADYANNHQDATNKIMQQQQKIYDLTKDVREGYLDALREMSVGAGEFEKIIGTQEMGVTQLMSAVDRFSQTGMEGLLNTFALGGMQSAQETAAGVGGQYMGQYSAVPGLPTLGFQTGADYQRGLSRYAGYDESIQQHQRNLAGVGGRSMVGAGLALNDQYEGALRGGMFGDTMNIGPDGITFGNEHYDKEKVVAKAAHYEALVQFFGRSGVGYHGGQNMDIMGGVHPILRRGGSGVPGAALERHSPHIGWSYGAGVAAGARGSSPADASPFTRPGRGGRNFFPGPYQENLPMPRDGGRNFFPGPYQVPRDVFGISPGISSGRSVHMDTSYWSKNLNRDIGEMGLGGERDSILSGIQYARSEMDIEKLIKSIGGSEEVQNKIREYAREYLSIKDEYLEEVQKRIEEEKANWTEGDLYLDVSQMRHTSSGTYFYNQRVPIRTAGWGRLTREQRDNQEREEKEKEYLTLYAKMEDKKKGISNIDTITSLADRFSHRSRMQSDFKHNLQGDDYDLLDSYFGGEVEQFGIYKLLDESIFDRYQKFIGKATGLGEGGDIERLTGFNLMDSIASMGESTISLLPGFRDLAVDRLDEVNSLERLIETNEATIESLSKKMKGEATTDIEREFIQSVIDVEENRREVFDAYSELRSAQEEYDTLSRRLILSPKKAKEARDKLRESQKNHESAVRNFEQSITSKNEVETRLTEYAKEQQAKIFDIKSSAEYIIERGENELKKHVLSFVEKMIEENDDLSTIADFFVGDNEKHLIDATQDARSKMIDKLKEALKDDDWAENLNEAEIMIEKKRREVMGEFLENNERHQELVEDMFGFARSKTKVDYESPDIDMQRARALRQQLGVSEGSTSDELFRRMNSSLARAGAWEVMSADEIKDFQRLMGMAAEKEYEDGSRGRRNIATDHMPQATGFTSARQKRGSEATAAEQAEWMSDSVQRQLNETFGTGMEPGQSGGKGLVEVLIYLSPELEGQVNSMSSAYAEIRRASGK